MSVPRLTWKALCLWHILTHCNAIAMHWLKITFSPKYFSQSFSSHFKVKSLSWVCYSFPLSFLLHDSNLIPRFPVSRVKVGSATEISLLVPSHSDPPPISQPRWFYSSFWGFNFLSINIISITITSQVNETKGITSSYLSTEMSWSTPTSILFHVIWKKTPDF